MGGSLGPPTTPPLNHDWGEDEGDHQGHERPRIIGFWGHGSRPVALAMAARAILMVSFMVFSDRSPNDSKAGSSHTPLTRATMACNAVNSSGAAAIRRALAAIRELTVLGVTAYRDDFAGGDNVKGRVCERLMRHAPRSRRVLAGWLGVLQPCLRAGCGRVVWSGCHCPALCCLRMEK